MRQQLSDHWTLELDPAYSRRQTDDGFTIFTKPGMEIWAVIYIEESFDSEVAVRSYFDGGLASASLSDFEFRSISEGIAGRACFRRDGDRWTLVAVAASLGRIVKLDFRFEEQSQVDDALAIWQTLQHAPPEWVRLCGRANPPLAELREVLESGVYIDKAIDEARDRGQDVEVKAVLLAALDCESARVRHSACEAFRYFDEPTEEDRSALRKRLVDDVVQVRAWAADTLLDWGEPPATVVPAMIEGLQKREPPLPRGEDRIQGICGYLRVPDRYHAARILSFMGEAARPAREALLEHQMDESEGIRLRVAEALRNIGEPPATVLPPLLDGFRNPDLSQRERVQFAKPLFELGVSPEEILPVVLQALDQSPDYSTRFMALDALGELGVAALPAADSLEKALCDNGIKIRAAQMLTRIGAKLDIACPILVAELDHEQLHPYARAEILRDLGRCVGLDASSLERIARELDAEEPTVRTAAALVLTQDEAYFERVLPILTQALDDPSEQTRWDVAIGLGQLGSRASATADRLMQLVRDDDVPAVRHAAIWALGFVGGQQPAVRAFLAERLADGDDEARSVLENALAMLEANLDR